jgi:putative ABC transport system permease protein
MNPGALLPLGVVAACITVVVCVVAIRRPALRRLAFRAAIRRPGETALVILGSMLGTAIITGSFIVGDTLDESVRSGAYTQLGPIDETVTGYGIRSLSVFHEIISPLAAEPEVDGVAFALRTNATVTAHRGRPDATANANTTLLELDFDAARTFGGDPAATGLGTVPTPGGGEVALSTDLAQDLGVRVGDTVQVFSYGQGLRLRVVAVLPRVGLAGYAFGETSLSYDAFVVPGTIGSLLSRLPQASDPVPPVALAFVSNRGDVVGGRSLTPTVSAMLHDRIRGLGGFTVEPTKARMLDAATEAGDMFSTTFLSIGSFAVIAGIVLLVIVFVMLAEERKKELGMMRAVGMRRGQLVEAFTVEGLIYSVAAAAIGAVVGIGVGWAIVQVASSLFMSNEEMAIELRFAAQPASIAGGFLIGLLIASVTVLLTSIRVSRINIIRAVRDIPEPPSRGPRRRTLVAGAAAVVLGVAWSVSAIRSKEPTGALVGPCLALAGLVPLLQRRLPRRAVVTGAGLAAIGWGLASATVLPDVFTQTDTNLYVLLGVILTFAAIAVLSQHHTAAARAVFGGRMLAAHVGLAYPVARRFRTAMTLMMYALVIFTLSFISVLASVFGGQVDAFTAQERGGYTLLVTSSPVSPVPMDGLAQAEGVAHVAPMSHVTLGAEFRPPQAATYEPWFVSGIDRRFVEGGPPPLDEWLSEYPDEQAAWDAVVSDPSLMIVDASFLQEGGPPRKIVDLGDTVLMRDSVTGHVVERTVVATRPSGWTTTGPIVSTLSLKELFGPRAATSWAFVALEPGTDPAALAGALETRYVEHGVTVRTFRSIVADGQATTRGFFRLMQGYLTLGLLVGVAGLGVIMVRAVRERRRQIGLLRALGFSPSMVARAFLVESGFVTVEGIVVGAALGLATAVQMVGGADVFGSFETTVTIPWREIVALLAVTVVASVAVTVLPARKASKIRPAAALRIAD